MPSAKQKGADGEQDAAMGANRKDGPQRGRAGPQEDVASAVTATGQVEFSRGRGRTNVLRPEGADVNLQEETLNMDPSKNGVGGNSAWPVRGFEEAGTTQHGRYVVKEAGTGQSKR